MKLAVTLFLVFASFTCFAQNGSLRIEPANVNKEVVVDDLDKTYQDITNITVTNLTGSTIDLVQEQVVGKKPPRWEFGTFNRRNESAPFIVPKVSDNQDPMRLGAGESATFTVVLNSAGQTGTGTVGVIFTDANVPGVNLGTANFTTRITRRAEDSAAPGAAASNGSRRPKATKVSLYPNPARERFFVEVPAGVEIGRVDVANTLGKRLKRYDRPPGKEGYDVENLPDGLYLISIYDNRGNILKTLRLLHRRFGA